ncbi:integrase [Parasedimentitalea marina]|uniref:Integrase n=1 Tax=Parasedimentitalea marina TaxID=2483033 RepID=A0A3T0N8N7_9RHOB|nr:integrase [Parasedimentitalea marina]
MLPTHGWAIRTRLEIAGNHRDLVLSNLAIDSKLQGCDLICLKVADVLAAGHVKERASRIQSKTQKTVRFEITEGTRKSLLRWIGKPLMIGSKHLWPGRFRARHYISMRRTKISQIYPKTGNLRAVQLLPGHTKMDSTVRYPGVELEDALAISEAVEIQ